MIETLIWGIVIFVITYLFNYYIVLKRNYKIIKKQSNKKNIEEKKIKNLFGLSILVPKFNLDIKKINIKYTFILISIVNAFIISTVYIIITSIPWNQPFQLLLGFVLLLGMIYALYELLGRYLVKKGWSKNEQ